MIQKILKERKKMEQEKSIEEEDSPTASPMEEEEIDIVGEQQPRKNPELDKSVVIFFKFEKFYNKNEVNKLIKIIKKLLK